MTSVEMYYVLAQIIEPHSLHFLPQVIFTHAPVQKTIAVKKPDELDGSLCISPVR